MKQVYAWSLVAVLLLVGALEYARPAQAQPSSQAFYPVYSKTNLAATGTTQIRTGSGVLHSVCINTVGGSSNVLTIYDNTASSGTTIAVINTTVAPECFIYDAAFGTGLRVVNATGTAADFTITYRAL